MHVKYFQRLLQLMPSDLAEFDSSRLMIAFLAFSGLDLLNQLDEIDQETKTQAIEWIYSLQVRGAGSRSGFQGSTTIPKDATKYQCGHLALTYTGLVTLLILGDDLSRVDRQSFVEGVRACQNPDGSFTAMVTGCESDMRFLYCACCVSAILDDWSGVDIPRATDYIMRSIVSIIVTPLRFDFLQTEMIKSTRFFTIIAVVRRRYRTRTGSRVSRRIHFLRHSEPISHEEVS